MTQNCPNWPKNDPKLPKNDQKWPKNLHQLKKIAQIYLRHLQLFASLHMLVTMHMEACLQGIILNVQLFTMVMSMAMMISGLTVELQKANIATGHKMTR